MFLSKKTGSSTLNKNKKIQDKPKRVLGGWDDEQQQSPKYTNNNKIITKQPSKQVTNQQTSLLSFAELSTKKQQQITSNNNSHEYYTWDQLNQMTNMQISYKQQLIQPGGIRIKPADNTLNQFLKEISGLSINYIASLLLSNIQVNYPFQIKAKALYAIQFLCKKNTDYMQYFRVQIDKLRQFPEPQDNIDNYKKILKNVLNLIGFSQSKEEIKVNYIDPGYNQPQKASQIRNFIKDNNVDTKQKKNQGKKPIKGPNQLKNKVLQQKKPTNNNLLDIQINQSKLVDLLQIQQQTNNNNIKNISFQQLTSSFTNVQIKKASQSSLNII